MAKIMTIRDSMGLEKQVRSILSSADHTVITAKNNHWLRRMISQYQPDLIVFSVGKIDSQSLETLHKLTSHEDKPPVLVLGDMYPKIPTNLMREAFLAGAYDVTEYPKQNSDVAILRLVEDTLKHIYKQPDHELF